MVFLNSISFIILSLTLNQIILYLPIVSADVILKGDSFDNTDTQQSSGNNVTLGFFRLQSSENNYIGIWYNDNPQRKIWVANRDKPIIGNGRFMIDDQTEALYISGSNGINTTLFNVTNQFGSGNDDAGGVIEDSGNFVLYDNNTTRNRVLWQSFDYPTDTLIPGMKLGYNLTTGQNWTLTSWLSDQIPASGAFTLRLEQYQNSPQLVIYRRENIYWSSGSLIPGQERFKGFLVSDDSGMSFTVQTLLQLSSKGQLIDGENRVLTPTFCYGYNSTELTGCAGSTLPNCRGRRDRFRLMGGDWSSGLIQYNDSSSISISDCMEICWNDCNCKGFSTNSSSGTGCYTWGRNAVFIEDTNKPAQNGVLQTIRRPKKRTWIWILVSIAILLTILITCLCYVIIRRRMNEEKEKRKRDDYIQQLTGSASFNYGDELEKGITDAPDVKIFSLKAILAATDNFSNENKLGRGGYGPVYKGKLFDGREIAVKRLSKTSGQGIEQFKSELILISKLQHTNLVRLYGCCIHEQEKMLIYEFMPNKSLDFFLFDKNKKERIDWKMRFNIIQGIAQGLLYLHKYSRMKVIHRDLKVSNVLLDENMNPKIADFGMARIFQENVTEAITNRVVGTYGYMAPEYAMGGTFSIKTDVFSFGVLILEIISGKRNSNFYTLDRELNLVGYAWELWKREESLELTDESLGESCDLRQLLRTIHVGLLCVQENADDRPPMLEVISMLNNEIADLPKPNQPSFLTGTRLAEGETKSTDLLLDKNLPVSVNGLTITIMKPR